MRDKNSGAELCYLIIAASGREGSRNLPTVFYHMSVYGGTEEAGNPRLSDYYPGLSALVLTSFRRRLAPACRVAGP